MHDRILFLLVSSGAGLWGCAGKTPSEATDDSGPADGADGDTGDTGGGGTNACPEPTVTFEATAGGAQDLTSYFQTGEYLTLAVPGRLEVCPGTWYARVLVRADVEIIGLGEKRRDTVLSGGESGTILDIAGPNVRVTVENVQLDRGAGLDVSHNSGGGGIYCAQDGVVTVKNALFTNNFANDGPAIYADGCILDIRSTNFEDNRSEDDGGAVTLWFSTATFNNVSFLRNTSLDGGAMAVFNSSVTATDTTFEDNTAGQFAGGVWVYESSISLTDSSFTGNLNNGGIYGGGLIVFGSATLERVSFSGNTAPLGGGLYVYNQSLVDATACDFSDNVPEDVFASDGSAEGGTAYNAGSGVSFSCASNHCTGL